MKNQCSFKPFPELFKGFSLLMRSEKFSERMFLSFQSEVVDNLNYFKNRMQRFSVQ